MWNKPWKYKEGAAINLGLLITGGLLQWTIGAIDWQMFAWPANIITLALLIVVLGMAYTLRSKVYALRFITQTEAAVPAIATAAMLTIIMGLTRQTSASQPPTDSLGLSKMLSFWPFVLIFLWMTVIVAEVAIHQAVHFKKQGIPSLVSHIGLFIFVTCGVLGSADMQKMKIYCEEGKPEWRAIDDRQQMHELPFAIELQRFSIDEYPPKVALFDRNTAEPLPKGKPQNIIIDADKANGTLMGWTISTEKYIENAMCTSADSFSEYNGKGAATAISVVARKGNIERRGWLCTGSQMMPMASLTLDDSTELAMLPREPLRYTSEVSIYTKEGQAIKTSIEVNKPYTLDKWKIYQYDYNKEEGKWSTLSIFELVADPWLPAVYAGLILLFVGAILMFVTSKKD